MSDVADRITEYLLHGGLFNPELMQHEKVRDLLIGCRDEIDRLREAIRRLADQDATLADFSGTIKPGAVVWQDCAPLCFDSKYGVDACRIVFRFTQASPNRFKGVADGFGSFDGKYGNGAVYVNGEDINMPVATLTYRLPDEQAEFDAAREGQAARSLLWAIDQHCRSVMKHGNPQPETRVLADAIRQMILQEPGVTLE